MRTTVLLAISVALVSCASSDVAGDRQRALQELRTFQGRNLEASNESHAVAQLLSELIPGRSEEKAFIGGGFTPWHIATVGSGSRARVVVFEGQHLFMIPSASAARVDVFDRWGNHVSSKAFLTGWRSDIGDVKIHDSPRGFPLIEVSMGYMRGGSELGHQLYSLVEDEVALVRLEAADGTPIRNIYAYPNVTIGPAVPTRSVEAFESSLESGDEPMVLQTLIWLAGEHGFFPRPPAKVEVCIESNEEAVLVERVRTSKRVRAAIARLSDSQDPWVQEAAKAAGE